MVACPATTGIRRGDNSTRRGDSIREPRAARRPENVGIRSRQTYDCRESSRRQPRHLRPKLGDTLNLRRACVEQFGAGDPYLPILEVLSASCREHPEQFPSLSKLPPGVRIEQLGDTQEIASLFVSFGIAMASCVPCIDGMLVLLFMDFMQLLPILVALGLSIGGVSVAC